MTATRTTDLEAMGQAARNASRKLATYLSEQKHQALLAIADELEAQAAVVIAQNALDLADGRANGLTPSLLDRLLLDEKRIHGLANDI
ncbi:MAG TPA: gamma-glutamyl-phosphate reductase, partial [Caldilineaceae bacterium]|nr:gamma-glutamyl-phosphate reductase [Caldilineaceae bacterium]